MRTSMRRKRTSCIEKRTKFTRIRNEEIVNLHVCLMTSQRIILDYRRQLQINYWFNISRDDHEHSRRPSAVFQWQQWHSCDVEWNKRRSFRDTPSLAPTTTCLDIAKQMITTWDLNVILHSPFSHFLLDFSLGQIAIEDNSKEFTTSRCRDIAKEGRIEWEMMTWQVLLASTKIISRIGVWNVWAVGIHYREQITSSSSLLSNFLTMMMSMSSIHIGISERRYNIISLIDESVIVNWLIRFDSEDTGDYE